MNAEWALIIVTVIYTMATIAICIFNYRSAKATREQTVEMKRQYDEENRPYIAVELTYEKKAFYSLRLTNSGKRIATKISVVFEQSFLDSLKATQFYTLLEGQKGRTCIIGVGQSYVLPIGSNELRQNNSGIIISGEIAYSDGKRDYSERFKIDFGTYATFFSTNSEADDLLKELRDIRKVLAERNGLL
jgi:hypothetical protein